MTGKLPEIGCSHISPDQCTGFTPPSCCERIKADDDDGKDEDNYDRDVFEDGEGAGMVAMTSMTFLLVPSALAVVV